MNGTIHSVSLTLVIGSFSVIIRLPHRHHLRGCTQAAPILCQYLHDDRRTAIASNTWCRNCLELVGPQVELFLSEISHWLIFGNHGCHKSGNLLRRLCGRRVVHSCARHVGDNFLGSYVFSFRYVSAQADWTRSGRIQFRHVTWQSGCCI